MILAAHCPISSVIDVAPGIHVLTFQSPEISKTILPGQFVNIRVDDATGPLLRRPFSVYRVEHNAIQLVFNVIGRGTSALSRKRPGDTLDVLGPLGVPFSVDRDDFETAVLVGGGLGVAPLPITTASLRRRGKNVVTFLGSRSLRSVVSDHLENVRVATDDGSAGYQGTVVDLLEQSFLDNRPEKPRIFGCGPTPMLRALAAFAVREDIPCEVSLEGPMGCGFGICQGCPVELAGEQKKYALMCKDGPTFDVRTIRI